MKGVDEFRSPQRFTNQGSRISSSAMSSSSERTESEPQQQPPFHVFHKVPTGDGPYVMAKHAQLVEKCPERAIALFRAAVEVGDRMDSALKDMAIVMKQQGRSEDAIDAICALRPRCSVQAQESLDNVLLDLYKSCGRLEEQIALLIKKLNLFHKGLAMSGKRTKTARSQGKKFQVSLEQEAARLLGNLGWAYMQQTNYIAAEAVYRIALSLEADSNKVCNLGVCLMNQGKLEESRTVLMSALHHHPHTLASSSSSISHTKSLERAKELLVELQAMVNVKGTAEEAPPLKSIRADWESWASWKAWQPPPLSAIHKRSCVIANSHPPAQPSPSQSQSPSLAPLSPPLSMACGQENTLQQQAASYNHNYSSDTGCAHENNMEQAEKLSGMVAAAWMLAACSDQKMQGEVGLQSAHLHTPALGKSPSKPLEGLVLGPSKLLEDLDLQQPLGMSSTEGRRRLPVFRDLTIVGSAAPLKV